MKQTNLSIIEASILAADMAFLHRDITRVLNAGAHMLHLDVMDGIFVPNISFGPGLIQSLRKHFACPFHVHLMIKDPDNHINEFIKAGADIITIHPESCIHSHRLLQTIQSHNIKSGIAINPSTTIESILYLLDVVDIITIMTVNPGFGGQNYIENQTQKISSLFTMLQKTKTSIKICVDGGINSTKVKKLLPMVNHFVMGTALFKAKDPKSIINLTLR